MNWINAWIMALTKPKEAFDEFKGQASVGEAAKMFALVGAVLGLLAAVLLLVLASVAGTFMLVMGVPAWLIGIGVVGIVVIPLLFALGYAVASFVSLWVFNFVCGLLGGKGKFEELYFLIALYAIPLSIAMAVVGVIPFLGALLHLLLMLYGLYLLYLVVKEVHGFDAVKFIMALVVEAVILVIIAVILGLVFAALFVALIPTAFIPRPF